MTAITGKVGITKRPGELGGDPGGADQADEHGLLWNFRGDFEPMKKRILGQGLRLLDAPPGFDCNGLWLRDPNDFLIEITIA